MKRRERKEEDSKSNVRKRDVNNFIFVCIMFFEKLVPPLSFGYSGNNFNYVKRFIIKRHGISTSHLPFSIKILMLLVNIPYNKSLMLTL
jgi:hypothetical protein